MAERGPAVIVMARAPRPGVGKSRLRAVLPNDARLRLQEAFLRDAVAIARASGAGDVYLAYTPADAGPQIEAEFSGGAVPFPQAGGELGARMLAALRNVYDRGHTRMLMIGTDAPLLRPDHLRDALRSLDDADLCLGPSEDGGYYLLGCRAVTPELFAGIAWGADTVLDATLRRAAAVGLRTTMLEPLYDVDTPADLDRLLADVTAAGRRVPHHAAEVVREFAVS